MTGNRQWHFSFWPVLAFVCVLPGLLALGWWQVQRGIEKQDVYERFAAASALEARDVTGLALDAVNRLPRYERIQVRGRYLDNRNLLLDNMPRKGRPGHHVLTPFVPEGAQYAIIVDRGWRPGIARDNTGVIPSAEGANVITGMLAPFPRPALMLGERPLGEGWPRVVQFPTSADVAAMLERPVATPRLLLSADADEGFIRDWSAPGIPPARHYAYAFQWFGLAIALIVIFILMARRSPEDSTQ